MSIKMGATIALDGEKEFRKAISDINTGLRVNASELALVTARYGDNANSVKALTDRQAALGNRITGQRDLIEKLRGALENSIKQYGEADIKTLKWQESLNKAQTDLIGMEGELKDNSEALDKATANMEKYGLKEDEVQGQSKQLGDVLGDVIGQLGINLPAGADKAIRSLDKTKISTAALIGVAAGIVTGFAKATIETSQLADEVLTMSSTTGLATDTLQELEYASEFVDVSVDTMTSAMTKMIRSMGDANDGVKTAEDAFRKLRLRITDTSGQLKNSEEMFYEAIDALGQVRNETERDAIAMDIFGRSARELNPLIEAGSKRLKELGVEAHDLGYVMDAETLQSLGALDDAMQRFDKQGDSFKRSIALVMLPPLTALFELLGKIDPKILATVAIIGTVAVVAISVVNAIGSITTTFNAMNPATLKTTAIVVGVVAALIALAAIIAVIIGRGDELNKTMKGIGNSTNDMISNVNQAPQRIGRNALGTNNWRGGLTWVGEEGPELVDLPSGSRVYNNKQSKQIVQQGEVLQNVYVTVQADDLQSAADVVRLFGEFRQVARQGV